MTGVFVKAARREKTVLNGLLNIILILRVAKTPRGKRGVKLITIIELT